MLRLSKLADYATVLMAFFATHTDNLYTAKEVSQETHLNLPTVTKLLKLLASASLLNSHRGVKGGYMLNDSPKNISLSDIIRAVDGPPALTECVDAACDCLLKDTCQVRCNWLLVNRAIESTLSKVSLDDFTKEQTSFEKPAFANVEKKSRSCQITSIL